MTEAVGVWAEGGVPGAADDDVTDGLGGPTDEVAGGLTVMVEPHPIKTKTAAANATSVRGGAWRGMKGLLSRSERSPRARRSASQGARRW